MLRIKVVAMQEKLIFCRKPGHQNRPYNTIKLSSESIILLHWRVIATVIIWKNLQACLTVDSLMICFMKITFHKVLPLHSVRQAWLLIEMIIL
ncbi:hypothetical protein D3C72_1961850 [compost metagenome]